jgi:predicted nucleic acid-binding protein
MPERIIIADTSCLISLQNTGILAVLRSLYGEITITTRVMQEFGEKLPAWFKVSDPATENYLEMLALNLDSGEASSIALALENPGSVLIIDERKGRAVARQQGLQLIGTVGILVAAKERGFITAIRPILDILERNGFRVSTALRNGILKRLGE